MRNDAGDLSAAHANSREPRVATPNDGAQRPRPLSPLQGVLAGVDAAASTYSASQLAFAAEIVALRLTHHQLRMLPVVGSYGVGVAA